MRWWLWAALQAFSCQLGLRDAFRWYLLIAFRLLLFWCLLKYHFFYWGIMWQLKLLFLRFRLPWVPLPLCWCGRRLRALTTPFGPVQRSWRIWSWVPGGLLGFFLLLFNWFGILIFLVYGLSDLMFQMTWPRRRHALELDWRSAQAYSAMHWAVWSKFHGSKFRSWAWLEICSGIFSNALSSLIQVSWQQVQVEKHFSLQNFEKHFGTSVFHSGKGGAILFRNSLCSLRPQPSASSDFESYKRLAVINYLWFQVFYFLLVLWFN